MPAKRSRSQNRPVNLLGRAAVHLGDLGAAPVEVTDQLALAAPAAAPQVADLADEFVDALGLGLVGMGEELGYDGSDRFGFGHGRSP